MPEYCNCGYISGLRDGERCPECEQPAATVDDLAMLTRRLVRALRKERPDSALASAAMDYLKRHGLDGRVLRKETES